MTMRETLDRLTERLRQRPRNALDVTHGRPEAAEEHARFEEALARRGELDESGALRLPGEQSRHDTPSGTDQSAG